MTPATKLRKALKRAIGPEGVKVEGMSGGVWVELSAEAREGLRRFLRGKRARAKLKLDAATRMLWHDTPTGDEVQRVIDALTPPTRERRPRGGPAMVCFCK